ncbi:MAG: PQQ-binding-like beta-propeller repeat protein [Rhodospirillaceae bacterium]|nr:PQQ-binding-like beta-propeller repeat protein [Rhodospirillaceae bacterium]
MTMHKGLMTAAVMLGVLPALAGCGGDWMGEADAPPLPGDRVSVLVHETKVHPDEGADKITIALPKPEANLTWPQTGGMSHHAMQHLQTGAAIAPVWQVSIGEGSGDENRLIATPVVADGKVFAMDARAHVSAFDAKTGDRLWRFDLTPEKDEDSAVRGGGLSYDKGRLFAATGLGEVWAIQANSGNFYWKAKLDSPLRAAPTVYGERVFVVTASNRVVAFAARDGKKLWEYVGAEEASGLLGAASPAADHGVLVVAMRSGALAALRAESGSLLWEESLSTGRRASGLSALGDVKAPPVISDGRVYAVGNAGLMVAIDLRTGRRVWEKEFGGVDLPWLAGKFIYLLTNNNEVIALDTDRGRVMWATPLSTWKRPEKRTGRIIWTGPILASDRLLVGGSHGYVLSISPYTGKVLGYAKLPDGVTVPPVAAGGTIYFLTDDADLVAYR